VLKPIKLLEGIGNGGNGALIRSTAILWTNDQHFILLRSIRVYGKPSPVDHLQSCPCRHAQLYRPMLIMACLTGVTGLVVKSMTVVFNSWERPLIEGRMTSDMRFGDHIHTRVIKQHNNSWKWHRWDIYISRRRGHETHRNSSAARLYDHIYPQQTVTYLCCNPISLPWH